MVWLPVFGIFNACTDLDSCDCARGLYGHRKRVCTEFQLWKENPSPHRGHAPTSTVPDTLPTEISHTQLYAHMHVDPHTHTVEVVKLKVVVKEVGLAQHCYYCDTLDGLCHILRASFFSFFFFFCTETAIAFICLTDEKKKKINVEK